MGELNASKRTEPNRALAPTFIAAVAGLGFLLASSLMLVNGLSPAAAPVAPAKPDEASFAPLFHIAELIAFAAGMGSAGAATAIASKLRKPAPEKLLVLLGAAFAFVSLAALWMKQGVDPARLTIPDALLCGGPVGIGNGLMLVLWARQFGALPHYARTSAIALATGLGIAASTLAPLALGHNFLVEWWTVAQTATCVTAAGLLRAKGTSQTPPATQNATPDSFDGTPKATSAETPSNAHRGHTAPTHRTSAESALAIVGLALFAFILGVYWRKFSTAIFYSELLEGTVALACGIALAVSAAALKERSGAMFRIALPLGAVLLLADPFLSFDVTGPMAPSGVSWTVCLVVFVLAGLDAAFLPRSKDANSAATGWPAALWCAALIAGIAFGEVTDPYTFKLAITATMIAYLAVLLAAYARRTPTAQTAPNPAAIPAETQPSAPERALAAAGKLGLSPREEEVFGFLIQGRGESYIADALCISVSTVKTHRRNIYRKLGVGSREELLDWYEEQ